MHERWAEDPTERKSMIRPEVVAGRVTSPPMITIRTMLTVPAEDFSQYLQDHEYSGLK
jgi:hypothetical protein